MRADFKNVNPDILYAARDKAGLIGPINGRENKHTIQILSGGQAVAGHPKAVMKLIGALAGMGKAELVSVL